MSLSRVELFTATASGGRDSPGYSRVRTKLVVHLVVANLVMYLGGCVLDAMDVPSQFFSSYSTFTRCELGRTKITAWSIYATQCTNNSLSTPRLGESNGRFGAKADGHGDQRRDGELN